MPCTRFAYFQDLIGFLYSGNAKNITFDSFNFDIKCYVIFNVYEDGIFYILISC